MNQRMERGGPTGKNDTHTRERRRRHPMKIKQKNENNKETRRRKKQEKRKLACHARTGVVGNGWEGREGREVRLVMAPSHRIAWHRA